MKLWIKNLSWAIWRENAYIVFAVQSNDPAQEQELMAGTQECADAPHGEAQTECMSVSEETREQAHEHGMSAGKYQASTLSCRSLTRR